MCWDLVIYIDPTSREVLEFGTKKFPYKTFNLAWLSVFNTLTGNTTAEVEFWFKEGTLNEIKRGSIKVVNIGHVKLTTYSELGISG